MAAPGTTIIIRDSAPPRSAPTDTGVWFVAGLTERGPEVPTLVTSLTDFVTKFGARQSYSILYDAVESYFREGGGRLYVSRVVGPAGALATANLFDASGSVVPGDVSLVVNAKSKGPWGNSLNVEVTVQTTNFTITVTDDVLGTLEVSPSMADRDTAVAWAANSQYIDLVLGASAEDPRAAGPTSLAGGVDDQGSITDAHWLTALGRFTRALGPGQVSFPGRSAGTAHADLLAHAVANNRVAILDSSDTAVVATIKAHSTALRLLGSPPGMNPRFGAVFAPWLKVPGITAGTTRTIPPSGTVAGMIARLDGQTGNPNLAAAGIRGASQFALETKYSFTDLERGDLNDNGVCILRNMYGEVRLYGYRTAVEPLTQPLWTNLANSRLVMAVAARADVIAERYVLAQLDGRMLKVNEYGGDLRAMLAGYYDLGALFGLTPEEAFNVDVGVTVNTPTSMAANELRAVMALRCSPFAERVIVELVKVATTEAVA